MNSDSQPTLVNGGFCVICDARHATTVNPFDPHGGPICEQCKQYVLANAAKDARN